MALPLLLESATRRIPVTMKTRGVPLDKQLKRVIYSNVRTAFGRFGKRVRDVSVWVEDTNGPREGSGLQCRMTVSLARGGRLSATAEAANEYAAVAECASRARTLLDRCVKRRRRARRSVRAKSRQPL